MVSEDAGSALARRAPEPIDAAAWQRLAAEAEPLRSEDTSISGWIHVVRREDEFLVLEEAPRGRLLLRRYADRAPAEAFVDRRLAAYDRMWDGCGCKIDYDEP